MGSKYIFNVLHFKIYLNVKYIGYVDVVYLKIQWKKVYRVFYNE